MIYSQSFFRSALREDSSKSNSRGGQGGRRRAHSVECGPSPFAFLLVFFYI